LVNEQLRHDGANVFVCEFCGSSYKDIETAEDCEQHCTRGFASAKIRKRAIHVPRMEVIPMW